MLEICLPEHPHTRVASWSKSGWGGGGGCLPEPLIPGSYPGRNPGGLPEHNQGHILIRMGGGGILP